MCRSPDVQKPRSYRKKRYSPAVVEGRTRLGIACKTLSQNMCIYHTVTNNTDLNLTFIEPRIIILLLQ